MKRILFSGLVGFTLLSSSCAFLKDKVARIPSSIQAPTSTAKPVTNYLKHYLIRNGGLGELDRQDCRGYAQQSAALCKSDTCKALLNEQEFRCTDQNCKAFITERSELCTDEVCKALVDGQTEKCKASDKVCQSMVNQDSAVCANEDCKAWLDQTPIKCKSDQCRAIVAENINFCDPQPK